MFPPKTKSFKCFVSFSEKKSDTKMFREILPINHLCLCVCTASSIVIRVRDFGGIKLKKEEMNKAQNIGRKENKHIKQS